MGVEARSGFQSAVSFQVAQEAHGRVSFGYLLRPKGTVDGNALVMQNFIFSLSSRFTPWTCIVIVTG